jgi:hypothetical protein
MTHLIRLAVLATLLLATALPLQAQMLRELDWLDLLTDADRQAMLDLPEIDHGSGDEETGEPVTLEQQIANALNRETTPQQRADLEKWDAVLTSKRVRTDLDGASVKLPGFIVPLQTGADGGVTEFFLVPYFGACIHVPPPPPNQIVLVRYQRGFAMNDIYTPIWIEGMLHTELISNEVAEAAYTFTASRVVVYEE